MSDKILYVPPLFSLLDKLSYQSRVSCLMLGILILPAIAELIVLVDCGSKALELWLVMDVVLSIIGFLPLSWLICQTIFLGHVRDMNEHCELFLSGRKVKQLTLPPEKPNEDDIIRLKRNGIPSSNTRPSGPES